MAVVVVGLLWIEGAPITVVLGQAVFLAFAELAMAVYFVFVITRAWEIGLYFGLPFLLLFHIGFLYTGLLSGLQPWLVGLRLRWASRTAPA